MYILFELLLVINIAKLVVDGLEEVFEGGSVQVGEVKDLPDVHSQGRPILLVLKASEDGHFFHS